MASVLVHVGYPKSGSGWLQRLFFKNPATGFGSVGKKWRGRPREHPSERLVGARPLEFDAARARAEFDALIRPIEERGLFPVVSFERFSGNAFSGGYDSKEIADRLAKTFPEALVLVVIREQRSMIVSTYKQYIREGGTLRPSRFMSPPTSKAVRVPWFDLRHFEYHHLLSYYRGLFGPDRVLALTFEQFYIEPAIFISEIGRFTGRPLNAEVLASLPFAKRSNPALPATGIAVCRRINQLGVRSDLNPEPLFPSSRLRALSKKIQRSELLPRHVVQREEAKLRRVVTWRVGDRYVESNRLTAELTGIDLGSLGWMV